jgi:hypothetical protein
MPRIAKPKAKRTSSAKPKSTARRAAASSRTSRTKTATKTTRGKTSARSTRAKAPAKSTRAKSAASSTRAKSAARKTATTRKAAAARSSRAKKTTRRAAARKPAAKKSPARGRAPRRATTATRARRRVVAPAVVAPVTSESSGPSSGSGDSDGGEAAEEDPPASGAEKREAVASFATSATFRDAVRRLLAAGFAPTDLSILASHESLELAGGLPGYRGGPGSALLAGLTDEVKFVEPLEVAGISALAAGPMGAVFAAIVAAGLGGAALEEFIERVVANRHAPSFAAALKSGGVLLWVRIKDPSDETKALGVFHECGGTDPHVLSRSGEA